MIKEYGYEYDAVLDVCLADKTAGECVYHSDHGAILLRSGRDALKSIAREYNYVTVLLPSLSCDSMAVPFRLYGQKIVYYKLLEDYSADYEDILSKLIDQKDTVLLLYMNYFGNPAMTDAQLGFIKKRYANVVFIEDRTHNLIYCRDQEFQADYTVASMRKWLNIPDGGLLWTELPLKNAKYSENTVFSETRRKAQCMRNVYFSNGDESIKSEYRKIFSTVTDQIDADLLPGRMTAYSYQMALATDWKYIREVRERNALVLTEILTNCKKTRLIQNDIHKSNLYVPILTEKRDLIQKELAMKGIFTTLIWPLSREQKKCCKTAEYTESHMLGIPCDQRYSEDDMRYIGKEIVKAIYGSE